MDSTPYKNSSAKPPEYSQQQNRVQINIKTPNIIPVVKPKDLISSFIFLLLLKSYIKATLV
jgi:hypothetical protein